ncbi:MAG: hypothetical protein ACHQ49_02570, partial [Elusimicrobiota bacterium]
ESRDAFKEKFGSDEFYVLFFPEVPDTVDSRLAPMLRARGIRSLEYDADVFYKEVGGAAFLHNGHPAPKTYAALAGRLAGDLAPRDRR